ncbi:hypothetical protein MKW92_020836 [Papaver armeniacum]|nr:hypothetical protein MKW92_020836 [Papaver armeniacum]
MHVRVPQEKQAECLSSLLIPLCNQVDELLLNANAQNHAKIANIHQLIMEINALSKTLDVLLQILVVFPKVDPLQSKLLHGNDFGNMRVMSFIHRMVEVLGEAVFPFVAMIGSRILSIALCFWKAETPKRRETIDLYIPYTEICRNGRVSLQYAQVLIFFSQVELFMYKYYVFIVLNSFCLNFMQVELKFNHINGNGCNYGPPYECQLASLLRAGLMDLI